MRTHIRRSAEQWQSLIDKQRASMLSAPQFCKQNQIGYASFCQWRKRLNPPSTTESTTPVPTFVAVDPIPPQSDNPHWVAELQLGSDIVLRVGKL